MTAMSYKPNWYGLVKALLFFSARVLRGKQCGQMPNLGSSYPPEPDGEIALTKALVPREDIRLFLRVLGQSTGFNDFLNGV